MESAASGTTVTAVFQSGCATLVRTILYFGAPVWVPLKTYPVKVVDGRIYVRVSDAEALVDHAAQEHGAA